MERSLSFEFSKGKVEGFLISKVNGDYKMTFMSQQLRKGAILDSSYHIVDRVHVDHSNQIYMHEFNFVENGTRALVINSHGYNAKNDISKVVEFDGKRHCTFDGFEELDRKTWKSTFDFQSYGKIGLDESTMTQGDINEMCDEQLHCDDRPRKL